MKHRYELKLQSLCLIQALRQGKLTSDGMERLIKDMTCLLGEQQADDPLESQQNPEETFDQDEVSLTAHVNHCVARLLAVAARDENQADGLS